MHSACNQEPFKQYNVANWQQVSAYYPTSQNLLLKTRLTQVSKGSFI